MLRVIVTRRLKPINELGSQAKRTRERFRKDPDLHQKYKKWMNEYYLKTKENIRIRKKLKSKDQRKFCIQALGSKCGSCGEPYNPNLERSNLELDHKFYLRGQKKPGESFRQVLRLIESEINPNKQFTLLCHSCHMVVTYVRRYPQKAKPVIDYLNKSDIMQE